MDLGRAQEILKSPETIQVLYQGTPVWIEKVHSTNSAEVTLLNNNEKINVPVNELMEQWFQSESRRLKKVTRVKRYFFIRYQAPQTACCNNGHKSRYSWAVAGGCRVL